MFPSGRRTTGERSWGSMLRTCRAAASVLALGGMALCALPQSTDLLAFIDETAIMSGGNWWPFISFQVALLTLGGSAWFWSRAALAARFGIADDRRRADPGTPEFGWTAYTWLPRIILFASFLVGVVIAARSHSPSGAFAAVVTGLASVALTAFRAGSGGAANSAPRFSTHGWNMATLLGRIVALLSGAPFGRRAALALLCLGLVPLVLGFVETFTSALRIPNRIAVAFPGPSTALLLLGLMIGPLTLLTFVVDGLSLQWSWRGLLLGPRRPPLTLALVLYFFVAVPAIMRVHVVRTLAMPAIKSASLDEVFDLWVQTCAKDANPIRPVIVDMSGGATRAGLFGAAVLHRVLAARTPGGPAIFAVSSVSGGSLGAAGAMTLLRQQAIPCKATGLEALRPNDSGVALSGDALGPLLGGWLVNDIPKDAVAIPARLFGLATGLRFHGGDSASAIEDAFSDLWDRVRPPGAKTWDRPYLELFYGKDGKYVPGMPLWLANGTDASTGNRVITTPLRVSQGGSGENYTWPFRGAREFHALTGADVAIKTSINNTARFPFLEPFGVMLALDGKTKVGSLIDGGYFENEGLMTALELARWLENKGTTARPVNPIIVQATSDGSATTEDSQVMSCRGASDGPAVPSSRSSLSQLFAPLSGLYHVRGGHSAALLREASDRYCPTSFVHFFLPGDKKEDIPLNWVVSKRIARFIWEGAMTSPQVGNDCEDNRLAVVMSVESAPGSLHSGACARYAKPSAEESSDR